MALRLVEALTPQQAGDRLRELRQLARLNQGDLAEALGYVPGQAGNVSKIEHGKEMKDSQRRSVANFLATQDRLTDDARTIYAYLVGDIDSIDACRASGNGSYQKTPRLTINNMLTLSPSREPSPRTERLERIAS